jgi:hypothetical protein
MPGTGNAQGLARRCYQRAHPVTWLRWLRAAALTLLVLTPAEAWALPTVSGKADADQENPRPHRLSWVSLVRNGHVPAGAVAEHRSRLLDVLAAGRKRRLAEMGP